VFTGSVADLYSSQQELDPILSSQFDAEAQFFLASQVDTIKSASGTNDSLLVNSAQIDSLLNKKPSKSSKRKIAPTRIIDINKATKSQLITLKGIGPSLAKRIVDYRSKNGPFNNVADIMNVKGIGKGKYNSIKDRIEISSIKGE